MGRVMLMICPLNFHSGRSGMDGVCTLNVTGPCSVCVCVCVCVEQRLAHDQQANQVHTLTLFNQHNI